MQGEPGIGATDPHDVDPDAERQAGDDGEREPGDLARTGHAPYRTRMCRSIKTLRRPGETATTGELEAAARQYVRKLSGFREPSMANRAAFDAAVSEIAAASRRLVEAVGVPVEDGPNRWVGRDGALHTGA
jgi:hypothetical protein